MTDRKLTLLGVVAAVMLVWAVVQSSLINRQSRPQFTGSAYMIQGLDMRKVFGIKLGVGGDAVTLKREGTHYVVASKDNYPASTKEINNLIADCLDIKREGLITDSAKNHEDLQVTEGKARNIIQFLDEKSEPIPHAGIVVGNVSAEGGGTYVRLASSDEVYLSRNVPYLRTTAMDYIDKKLTELEADTIVKVTVTDPNGPYSLTKHEGKMLLDQVPEGKQAKESDLSLVFEGLSNLEFSDFRKAAEGLEFDRSYVCRLADSTVYTFKIAQQDGKTYVTCRAQFTGTQQVVKSKEVESLESLKKKEAILLAQEHAKTFTKKHSGWVYEIPSWRARNLTKKLSDLVEEIPQEEKPEEAKAPVGEPIDITTQEIIKNLERTAPELEEEADPAPN